MKKTVSITTPGTRAPGLNVLGVNVVLLSECNEANSYQITLQKGEAGNGPPPHSHGWDESFYVLSGSVEFFLDGESELCRPGSLVHIPAHTTHGFQFGPQGGEMLELTGSGSQAAQMFTEVDKQIPPGPPDLLKVTEVLRRNGVTLQA